ncbi:putative F-box/LRR-repeat protein At3g18150 isoform X2 [Phoenix dactylifera]|uniref:F-box/LRR-repeat protein At3g18150 isoform X2 n=1 Tax=Phoenix dactylifera TaxID=42345 RepID=A0A8B8ZL68_PHODC|nr:putative F-box/LRR-repeat protein At3g18150 isoform X2 [Phoenix dactylifera]
MTFLLPDAMRKKKKPRWTAEPSLASADSAGAGDSSSSAAAGADRLTDLPDALRLHILSFLPLKYAVRTGVLSRDWRNLWKYRWPHPSSLDLSVAAGERPEDFLDRVGCCLRHRGRRRLDVLRIAFHPGLRHGPEVIRWLEYASACGVEDLHVDLSPPPPSPAPVGRRRPPRRDFFHLCESPNLSRLTVCGFHLSCPAAHFKRLSSLEILCLHSISITDAALRRIIAACPRLRSLDLRYCRDLRRIAIPASGFRLASLTIVHCPKVSELTVSAPGLRSFRFSGAYLTSYCLDNSSGLEDVYMSSGGLGSGLPRSNWVKAIGRLSNVKVLTLCSLSLQYITVSGANAIEEFRNFRNLRELQLLMVMMTDSNLTDIYSFFTLCRCPSLERLFIELPTNMYDPYMEKYLEVVEEKPPEVAFENLKVIKMNNFKGHNNEIELFKTKSRQTQEGRNQPHNLERRLAEGTLSYAR